MKCRPKRTFEVRVHPGKWRWHSAHLYRCLTATRSTHIVARVHLIEVPLCRRRKATYLTNCVTLDGYSALRRRSGCRCRRGTGRAVLAINTRAVKPIYCTKTACCVALLALRRSMVSAPPAILAQIDRYRRAANFLAAAQMYLQDNCLLEHRCARNTSSRACSATGAPAPGSTLSTPISIV